MNENSPAHILIVDDDPDILIAGKMVLKARFARISTLAQPQRLPDLLARDRPDVILLDMNFGPGKSSGAEGLDWIDRILAADPDAVVIIITAHGGVRTAVEAMKRGATDFITKPWQNEKLLATVSAGVALAASRAETGRLKSRTRTLAADSARADQPIIGSSRAIKKVLSLIERAAPSDANVLILGENGTGKELAARALHRASGRADEIFLSVDLGAVPESLFESELFGHKRGAFTGAGSDRVGRLAAASGGTLFLDEIGNLPLHLQAKLLSALERRAVTPVGATESVDFDVRLVTATNMPAAELADPNRFRPDLLYRLNTVEIRLPPLRERADDIPELVRHYLALYQKKYARPQKRITAAALDALKGYSWPGNVRALRHAVERAVILATGEAYEAADFSLPETARAIDGTDSPGGEEDRTLNLEQLERRTIQVALNKHGFNISHAADELGLTRAALYRRMEKHGL